MNSLGLDDAQGECFEVTLKNNLNHSYHTT